MADPTANPVTAQAVRWQPCPRCGWYACILGDCGACTWCGLVWYTRPTAGAP